MADTPLYYMLGQDSFRGDITDDFLTENANDAVDDAEASIDIYNHNSAASSTYTTVPPNAESNTQSAGDLLTVAMDTTLFRYILDEMHPTGVAFVKRTDQGALGGDNTNKIVAQVKPIGSVFWITKKLLVVGRE